MHDGVCVLDCLSHLTSRLKQKNVTSHIKILNFVVIYDVYLRQCIHTHRRCNRHRTIIKGSAFHAAISFSSLSTKFSLVNVVFFLCLLLSKYKSSLSLLLNSIELKNKPKFTFKQLNWMELIINDTLSPPKALNQYCSLKTPIEQEEDNDTHTHTYTYKQQQLY